MSEQNRDEKESLISNLRNELQGVKPAQVGALLRCYY
jgi:hypothetical protein